MLPCTAPPTKVFSVAVPVPDKVHEVVPDVFSKDTLMHIAERARSAERILCGKTKPDGAGKITQDTRSYILFTKVYYARGISAGDESSSNFYGERARVSYSHHAETLTALSRSLLRRPTADRNSTFHQLTQADNSYDTVGYVALPVCPLSQR